MSYRDLSDDELRARLARAAPGMTEDHPSVEMLLRDRDEPDVARFIDELLDG